MFIHKLSFWIMFSLAEITLFGAFFVSAVVYYSRQLINSTRYFARKGKIH